MRCPTERKVFTSFGRATAEYPENVHRPAFGGKELRFDGQLELKEYFNRDPGPGTYSENHSKIEGSLASELKKIRMQALGKAPVGFATRQKKFKHIPNGTVPDPSINVAPGQYDPPSAGQLAV